MLDLRSRREALKRFFTAPLDPKPLGLFRIAIALVALVQAILWYPDWQAFFGKDGWMQWEISQALTLPWDLHIGQVAALLARFGLDDVQSLTLFYWTYVTTILGLLLGWHTRVWAVLTWFCHYIIMSSLPTYIYGVDIFLQIAFFYTMVLPTAKGLSLDARSGRVSREPSWGATLGIRVLQIHLCLVYLSSGAEKMAAKEWWQGNVLWRALVQPDFRQYDLTWLARYPWIAMIMSWFTMTVETGYFVGMWIPRLRIFWLAGIVLLHLGIIMFLGLWLFGSIMIALSVSAFGYAALEDVRGWRESRKRLRVQKSEEPSPAFG